MTSAIQALDASVLLFIQERLRFDALDAVMRLFSLLGDFGACWILTGVVLLIIKKTRRGGFELLLCLAFAWAVNNLLLKNLIARPRPWLMLSELELLVAPLRSYSFPSGHACSSFAAATALCIAFRGRGAWAFIPASLIALSRLHVGVHYPTDVLAGAAIGALTAFAVIKAKRRLEASLRTTE